MTLRIDEIILSKDLSLAKVKCYHKVEIASLLKILNANRFSTQKHIKDTLEIRRIPKIKFIESPAYTKQQELEKVLNEIATD
jgi:ribosome-binding factor A